MVLLCSIGRPEVCLLVALVAEYRFWLDKPSKVIPLPVKTTPVLVPVTTAVDTEWRARFQYENWRETVKVIHQRLDAAVYCKDWASRGWAGTYKAELAADPPSYNYIAILTAETNTKKDGSEEDKCRNEERWTLTVGNSELNVQNCGGNRMMGRREFKIRIHIAFIVAVARMEIDQGIDAESWNAAATQNVFNTSVLVNTSQKKLLTTPPNNIITQQSKAGIRQQQSDLPRPHEAHDDPSLYPCIFQFAYDCLPNPGYLAMQPV
ncbi:uncharacterized protein BT62DRAFT_923521 [Guyanagaster necrorhizus]|uniref:Uncharacterized protein n=1 Tax=Guyanagaster necrorhizus TaxID=856835 RepID=A0A9P7VI26_9AGAR|nr:uncharacterized protein BT62DRAFT_923521 [Guyanagaster necrorhizus MCA 3950]KAG7441099.1 hypothetical protein BT62DRAFT_923521 [Guyanagaster necrorhizus MCA 3950]